MTNYSALSIKANKQPGQVVFSCPRCLKVSISRTPLERKKGVKYVCPECKFEGPN